MPKDEKPEAPDTKAADAAVAEVAAETDDKADTVDVEHAGVKFTVSRKKLDSVQFRRFMQRGRDILALEWLLTPATVTQVLDAMADEDGVTSDADFGKVFETIGSAVGAGNS